MRQGRPYRGSRTHSPGGLRTAAAAIRRAILLAALAASAIAPGCGSPGTTSGGPNVVIIVMDTARQDRLSCYGYERDTSPRLRELARESTVFSNAYSTSSWTAPGHASLFTGLYSIDHRTTQEDWSMSEDLVTIAEVLAEHGYETVGISENPMLTSARGYAQGFGTYHEAWRPGKMAGSGNQALDRFVESLDALGGEGTPFFIFVNLIAPHSPYNTAKQFHFTQRRRAPDREPASAYGEFVSDPTVATESNMWRQYYLGEVQLSATELEHLNELYDEELRFADFLVGRMNDELNARGLAESTLFIVTSDHGENIGDHGHVDHVFTLYESTTKIPLVVRQPGRFEPGEDARHVQLVDIFPTVLAAAGIGESDYPSDGLDLADDAWQESRTTFCEYYYPEQVLQCYRDGRVRQAPALRPYLRRIRSVTNGGMKLVWGSDGRHELYNLAGDPRETTNLIGRDDYAPALASLLLELDAIVGGRGEPTRRGGVSYADTLDEATRDAMRSLGYLE